MKLIRIIEDVSIPSCPKFRKKQQVRVKDDIADLLIERGHAKLEKGKSEDEVKKLKKVEKKADVEVAKIPNKQNLT